MDRWIYGWEVCGRMDDGWVDEWMDGWMGGLMDGRMNNWRD